MTESAEERESRWLAAAREKFEAEGYPEPERADPVVPAEIPRGPKKSVSPATESRLEWAGLILSGAVVTVVAFVFWRLDASSWNAKSAYCQLAPAYVHKPTSCVFYQAASAFSTPAAVVAILGTIFTALALVAAIARRGK